MPRNTETLVAAIAFTMVALVIACSSTAETAPDATPSPEVPGEGGLGSGGTSGSSSGASGSSGGSSGGHDAASDGSHADADASDAAVDAGDPPPAPCTRAAEARTAPASLYDLFMSDLVALPSAARPARASAFLAAVAAQGGAPLEDPKTGRAVFLASGAPPSGPWSIVGSFVAWDKNLGLPMIAVPDTDLWVVDTAAIAAGTSHTYKLLSGLDDSGYREDPLARNVVWDGVYRGAITEYNVGQVAAVIHPAALPATKGRLVVHGAVHATMLNNDRKVYVYFPPKYDDGTCADLPTILFHDGNEAVTRGDYAGIADTVYSAAPDLSAVLVFAQLASPVVQQRIDEYSFGGGTSKGLKYVDFLASDLWPAIKASYRVCTAQASRGVAGVSLGGLISSFAAFEKPAEWGWVGAQSPSLWWSSNAMITRTAVTSPKIPVRFYLDSTATCTNGGPNVDNCDAVDAMATQLAAKGYDYLRVKTVEAAPEPHDWPYFKVRAAQMLTHFRENQNACN
jgi:enterochelin esterase-like enzyme